MRDHWDEWWSSTVIPRGVQGGEKAEQCYQKLATSVESAASCNVDHPTIAVTNQPSFHQNQTIPNSRLVPNAGGKRPENAMWSIYWVINRAIVESCWQENYVVQILSFAMTGTVHLCDDKCTDSGKWHFEACTLMHVLNIQWPAIREQ